MPGLLGGHGTRTFVMLIDDFLGELFFEEDRYG
jgi:hypothetical protein